MKQLSQQRRQLTTAPTAPVKKTTSKKKEKAVPQQQDLRKMRMDSRLNEKVHKNTFVPPKDDPEPYELDLIPGHDKSPDRKGGFIRNKRTVAMRVDDELSMNVSSLDNQKVDLIQKLNQKMVELDRVNEEKRMMNDQLIKQIQFVREMQAQLGTQDNTNVADIIDKGQEDQLRDEKRKGQELKEQVKLLEIERKEILDQLKLLQGQKDVTIVRKSGNEMNLQKAMMGVNDMLKYRETVLQDLDRISRDYSASRAEDENLSRHVHDIRSNVDKVHLERSEIADQVRDLQSRYDATYYHNEQEMRDLAYKLRMQQSQKRSHQFLNSLAQVVHKRKLAYFQELCFHIKCDEDQISSVLAFRKLLYSYRERRQRKYLQLWFQNGLQPGKVMKVNREITNWQMKHSEGLMFLRKWNEQTLISNQQSSFRNQCVKNFTNCFKRYSERQLRLALDKWRMCKMAQHQGRKDLVRFIRQRMETRQKQALQKWRGYIQEENEMIRLHNQKVRFTILHLKQAMFFAWRTEAKNLKALRISLQLRVWSALKKNVQRQQLKTTESMQLIKLEGECTQNLLRMCFNSLKLSKEQEKHSKVFERLDGSENAQIEADSATIQKVRKKSQLVAQKRAVKQGVIGPFAKVLKSYFEKWKKETKEYKRVMNDKVKQRIIKMYKSKLSEAFEKWKVKGEKKRRRKKMKMTEEIMQQNEAMVEELKKTEEKIAQQEVRSMQKGNTKIKKMLHKVYLQELKTWLLKWKGLIDKRNKTKEKFDKAVLKKMRKRFYREAFDKFKMKTQRKAQMAKNEDRTDELILKFQKRELRKIYNAWLAYKTITIKARQKFKKCLQAEYLRYNQKHFDLWKNYKEQKKLKKGRKRQKMKTEEMQQKVDEKGEVENLMFEKEKEEKALVRSSQSLGKKTIRKTIARFKRNIYADVFKIWRDKTKELKKGKSKIGGAIFLKKLSTVKHDAFTRWRKNLHLKDEKQKKFSTQCEIENEAVQEESLQQSRTRIKRQKEMTVYKVDKLKKKQDKKKQLVQNNIAKLIKDKNDNFVVPKIQHLFDVWRQIASHRAKCLRQLNKLMTKNLLQHGLDNLAVSDHTTTKNDRQLRTLKRFFHRQMNLNVRGAFDKWKTNKYKSTVARQKKLEEDSFHAQKNSDINREKIIEKRCEFFLLKNKNNLLKNCFIALFDYRCKKQFQRAQQNAWEEKQQACHSKYLFQKWVLRSDHSIIYRQKLRILKRYQSRLYKRSCFDILKNQKEERLRLKNLLERIRLHYQRELVRDGFEEIKFVYEQKRIKFEKEQRWAGRVISEFAMKAFHKNLKQWFDKFLTKGKTMQAKKLKTQQFLNKQIYKRWREVFDKWKKTADMLEVIRYNNEEGPVRLEVNKINQEVKNLRFMLKDKMILPTDAEIDEVLKQSEDRYKNLADKSFCRLLLYGEGNRGENFEWLKPYCLNLWKEHMIKKKKQQPMLHLLEKKIKDNPLDRAFHTWKHKTDKIIKVLQGKTQEELFNRDAKNVRDLTEAAGAIEDMNTEIGDLKQQRDFLVDKVVIGQRLALARCRFSFIFAMEKVWVKLNNNSVASFRKEYDTKFSNKINGIAEAKAKILELEELNTDIAEQNDGLKEGTAEGVKNLQEFEQIEKEVESMNEQIVDQAEQIKQLLAENKRLKQMVNNPDLVPTKG